MNIERKIKFIKNDKKIIHKRRIFIINCTNNNLIEILSEDVNIGFYNGDIDKVDSLELLFNIILEFEPDVIVWDLLPKLLNAEILNFVNLVNFRFPGPFICLVTSGQILDVQNFNGIDIFIEFLSIEVINSLIQAIDLRSFSK